MIVQCKECRAKYRLDERRLKPAGSKVRCSKCGHVFFVMIDEESDGGFSAHPGKNFSPDAQHFEGNIQLREKIGYGRAEQESGLSPESGGFAQSVRSFFKERTGIGGGERESSANARSPQSNSEYDPNKGPLDEDEIFREFGKEKEFGAEISESSRSFGRKRDDFAFDWESLAVHKEAPEPETDSPNPFDEPPPEEPAKNTSKKRLGYQEGNKRPGYGQDRLAIDNEKLLFTQIKPRRSFENDLGGWSIYHKSKGLSGSSWANGLKKLASTVFTFLVLAVIAGAGFVIAANLGLISKDKSDAVISFVVSKLPSGFVHQAGEEASLSVSDHEGRWVSTRNGYAYVVSGHIVNKSDFVVNYIELESEFTSGGKKLFGQTVYAGNTFTEEELRALSVSQTELKLLRKNGDINFANTDKLAGLNYNVKPGESVPFFSVFPAESKVLGLKYDVQVADFEKAHSE